MSDWQVALIAAGAALAGPGLTGWLQSRLQVGRLRHDRAERVRDPGVWLTSST
ncbi:MAG TPA: hypothetical protein VMF65_24395 [Acidimicrobiales bacterium]|nr:hypothetical protein [Acidimicrobiales bacterium]